MTQKQLFLNEKFKIFEYHFPDNPLLPGALCLDICKSKIKEDLVNNFNNCVWEATFKNSCFPNDTLIFLESEKKGKRFISALSNGKEAVKVGVLKSEDINNLQNEDLEIEKVNDNLSESYNPIANHAKEILYLDTWRTINNDENSVIACGKYQVTDKSIAFLSEMINQDSFGEMFMLVEFMGLTVLSSMIHHNFLKLEDNYGFIKLNSFWYNKKILSNDNLVCVTKGSLSGGNILRWSGSVYYENKLIGSIKEGLSVSLRKGGGVG